MNKLEYEMNEVAKRAAEKAIKEAKIVDAKKFIGYAKNHGTNLENTIQEINIQKLAESSGFLSRSNFIKSFTEKEGCTPGKWKKANLE